MHENFGVFRREEQMLEQGAIVQSLRERYERVVVEDKGDVFNSDLTQALELGYSPRSRGVHGASRDSRGRRAAALMRALTTSRAATTRTTSGTPWSRGRMERPSSTGSP